jgi:hypothetical protein
MQDFLNYIKDSYLFKESLNRPPFIDKKISLIWSWVSSTTKLGDIISYFESGNSSTDTAMVQANNQLKNETGMSFLDFSIDLKSKFPGESENFTQLDSFIVGELYSSFDICFLFSNYNVQRSILYSDKLPHTVFAKVGLGGEGYINQPLEDGTYKYYLFSRTSKGKRIFDEAHVFNKELLPGTNNKIYLLLKDNQRNYKLLGLYESIELVCEESGAKWVRLRNLN